MAGSIDPMFLKDPVELDKPVQEGNQVYMRQAGYGIPGLDAMYRSQDEELNAMARPQQMGGASPMGMGDNELDAMRQAYAEQEKSARPISVPSEDPLGLSSQPSQPSTPSAQGESSGFDWGRVFRAMQSGGAAYHGDFTVPQQWAKLGQDAELKKQEYALQQQKLAEEQKQHAFTQVTTVLANKDLSESQKAAMLEGFTKGNNAQMAQFARTAMDGIGKKRMGKIGLYMERYPSQVKKIVEGMQSGQMSADDIDARLSLMDEVEKHNAKISGETDLEDEIRNNPKASAGQKAWLAEREAKRLQEQTKAQVEQASAPFKVQKAAIEPVESIAKINHLSQESSDKSTLGREAEGLMAKPWNQLSGDEKRKVLDYHQQREVEKQEAGARAREQVKTESSLAPGVMIHKQMTSMVQDVKDLFMDESAGTLSRVGQMAKTRAKYFAGDEHMRQWSQMEDGMRATLARMAMEVGNLAATEQDRAKQLVPDLYGSLYGVPDSKQVAEKKLQLLGDFLKAGLEGPQGPDAQSRVQNSLRETLKKLDQVAPLPSIGNVSPTEVKMIQDMKAAGMDKRTIQGAILKQRGEK